MNIDSINNGIVLDHITAGKSLQLYQDLELDKLDCSIAIIKNVKSGKMGKKDIIKIANNFEIDLQVIGYVDPNISVCIIRDGKLYDKFKVELPETIRNIVKCKNPRCITSVEQEIDHIFNLVDRESQLYRCAYCEASAKGKE